jgi:diguanylate cyclase (GGDEF)-like protein/PAS domain S-box-containing protein
MGNEQKPPDSLRAEAEAKLAHEVPPVSSIALPTESLLYEIQVHQVELEMQNEALRSTQVALEESRNLYVDLYEFAPVGYITLSNLGLISRINFTGSSLLGFDRSKLINRRFSKFVSPADEDGWRQFFVGLLQHNKRLICEVAMQRGDGSEIHVRLDCTQSARLNEEPQVLISIIDITLQKQMDAALQGSEERYRSLAEDMPHFVATFVPGGTLTYVNRALTSLAGLTRDELIGRNFYDFLTAEDCAMLKTKLALLTPDNPIETHVQRYLVDGKSERFHEWTNRAFFDSTGRAVRFQAVGEDITARIQAEEELRIAAIAFDSQEGMLVTDANSAILRVNNAFCRITGYNTEEVIGKNPRILSSGNQDSTFYAEMWGNLTRQGFWEGEIWNKRKNGEIYPEHLCISAVKDQAGIIKNYVATLTDITMSRNAAEEIQQLAFYDPLTLLPNRRLLTDRLKLALASSARSGKEGAILFLDLDNFKSLNDTLGHGIGDQLLQQAAHRIESCVREGDTVARLGGDEFVVMLEDLSEHPLEAAAQTEAIGAKMLAAFNRPYQLAGREYHNTSSIGATLFGSQSTEIDELLKQADIAMYQAKKAGRNTLRFFDPEMQASVNKRAELEIELHHALEGRQFRLFYQIQVDSAGKPLGAETLIRWQHPQRGLMQPNEFIHLAEESGLILPIGQWVLETACAQIKAWQNNPVTRNLTLSVNVSAKQFHEVSFVAQVRDALLRYSINPELLKLEPTESILFENIEDTVETMNALKAIGVNFSLDDFGTGFSSLQYLKRLPLNQLKIDQSFVRDLVLDSNDLAIVRAIIAMAQSLNLEVIAEGVETEEQHQILRSNGCNHYQGYLFGKPVPIDEFEAALKRG